MRPRTVFLGKLLGLYLVAVSVTMFAHPQATVEMMKGIALAAITGGLSSEVGAKTANDPPCGYLEIPVPTGDRIHLSDSEPMGETAYGKILGYSHNGVYAFKAVRYAADTSGTSRLMPSQKPAPWSGVRSCLYHGFVCSQPQRAGWKNNEEF